MADNNQGMPANLLDEGQSYIQETSTTAPTILLSEPSSTSGINPLVPAIFGAGAGVAAPIPRHIAENLANIRAKQIESNAPPSASSGAGAPSPGAKYAAKTGYGFGPGYTVKEVVQADKAQSNPIGSGKISGKIGRNTPMNIDAMQALEQQKLEENARRAATLKMEAEAAMSPLQRGTAKVVEKTIPTKLQNIAGAVDEAFVPSSKQWWARGVRGTGRGIQGGMGVAQTIDAVNKGNEGDVPGAVMSGIGAAGNLATFIPSPITRVGGTIVGGLPFAGNMIGSANAEPLDVPGTVVDVATGLMGAPGLALSPSSLGEATIRPKNKAYQPGMTGLLHGTKLPPEGHAEGGDIKKPSAGIAGGLPSISDIQNNITPQDQEPISHMADGGSVQHFQVGGLAKLAAKFARHPHGQDARVAQALEEYLKGNISQEERIRVMNQFLPIRQWDQLPPNYTDDEIRNALLSNKQPKALAPVPVGMRVGNRLDIPAYTQHGVYIDTTHDAAGKPISYGRTGHLKDVEFSSSPDTFVRVGLGTKEQALTPLGAEIGTSKTPKAMIKGTHQGTPDDEVRRMMAEMMQDPNYTQIGMDPRRHSQFYDKTTGMPVWAAEEKLQSGPLIIAPKKGLETTSWDDPRLNLSDFPGKKYADGGDVKKPEADEGAFIGYPQINKNRKIGSGTGFLDALVGAPPSRENILNPSDYSYMEGYQKGEPYGIAGMVLPFSGAAAKPLAKEIGTRAFMGESLTPKMMRGLMPETQRLSLEAWHGTPHNIQGKLDLAKVGTGEGAQSYGHGIYFAQKPDVATGYKTKLGEMEMNFKSSSENLGISPTIATHNQDFKDPLNAALGKITKGLKRTAIDYPDLPIDKRLIKEHFDEHIRLLDEKYPQELAQKKALQELIAKEGYPDVNFKGNLYKVDIPDEHIPKMLDWDKRLSDQPHIWDALPQNVKNSIDNLSENWHSNPMSEALHDYKGSDLYNALSHHEVQEFLPAELPGSNWYTGDTTYPKHASAYLNSLDVPGIKYLDQVSRENAPSMRIVNVDGSTKYEVNPIWNKPNNKKFFDNKQEALNYMDSFGTKNFVSFKPEEVKLLEKNGKPLSPLSNLE